jgi:amyloid beta precursor protein binding protein 1
MRALKDFVDNEGAGLLPLRGSIPDMFSDSERFISLQNIYRNKAQHDLEAITSRIEHLLYNIDKPYDFISEQQIKLFCKNAYFLKVIRGRSLNNEYDPQNSKLGILLGKLGKTFKNCYLIRFFSLFKRKILMVI